MSDETTVDTIEEQNIESPFVPGKQLVPVLLAGCLFFAGLMIIGTLLAAHFVTPILEARDKKEVRKMSSQDSVGTPSAPAPAGTPSQ